MRHDPAEECRWAGRGSPQCSSRGLTPPPRASCRGRTVPAPRRRSLGARRGGQRLEAAEAPHPARRRLPRPTAGPNLLRRPGPPPPRPGDGRLPAARPACSGADTRSRRQQAHGPTTPRRPRREQTRAGRQLPPRQQPAFPLWGARPASALQANPTSRSRQPRRRVTALRLCMSRPVPLPRLLIVCSFPPSPALPHTLYLRPHESRPFGTRHILSAL